MSGELAILLERILACLLPEPGSLHQPLHGLGARPFVFAESLTQVLNLHNGPTALPSIEILPVEIR